MTTFKPGGKVRCTEGTGAFSKGHPGEWAELVAPDPERPVVAGAAASREAMAELLNQLQIGDEVKLIDRKGAELTVTLIGDGTAGPFIPSPYPPFSWPDWVRIEVVSLVERPPDWADDSHVIATCDYDTGSAADTALFRRGTDGRWRGGRFAARDATDLRDVVRLTPGQLAALAETDD